MVTTPDQLVPDMGNTLGTPLNEEDPPFHMEAADVDDIFSDTSSQYHYTGPSEQLELPWDELDAYETVNLDALLSDNLEDIGLPDLASSSSSSASTTPEVVDIPVPIDSPLIPLPILMMNVEALPDHIPPYVQQNLKELHTARKKMDVVCTRNRKCEVKDHAEQGLFAKGHAGPLAITVHIIKFIFACITHNTTMTGTFFCNICNNVSRTMDDAVSHSTIHGKLLDKPRSQRNPLTLFDVNTALRRLTRTNQDPIIVCPVDTCRNSFTHPLPLVVHYLIEHPTHQELPYCSFCWQVHCISGWEEHFLTHHADCCGLKHATFGQYLSHQIHLHPSDLEHLLTTLLICKLDSYTRLDLPNPVEDKLIRRFVHLEHGHPYLPELS